MVKVKIINNSSREIPQELTEEMMFKPLSEVQQILEEYNLKCHSYTVCVRMTFLCYNYGG